MKDINDSQFADLVELVRSDLIYLYVFPELRRRGIAKKTIAWIDDYAKQHDVSEIKLNVFASNAGIREFYSSVGFGDVTIGMTKTYKRPS